MKHHSSALDQSAKSPQNELASAKREPFGPERQVAFLRALASTHCVDHAAKIAGVGRSSAYRLRAKLRGEAFDLAWQAALNCGLDALADAALDRALHGVEVPHFHNGELIHVSRKYDERLTIALLAMRERTKPSYIPQSHPASAYTPDGMGSEFGALLRRIDAGLERWSDQWP